MSLKTTKSFSYGNPALQNLLTKVSTTTKTLRTFYIGIKGIAHNIRSTNMHAYALRFAPEPSSDILYSFPFITYSNLSARDFRPP